MELDPSLRQQRKDSQEARDNVTQIQQPFSRTTKYDATTGSFVDIVLSKKPPFDADRLQHQGRHAASFLPSMRNLHSSSSNDRQQTQVSGSVQSAPRSPREGLPAIGFNRTDLEACVLKDAIVAMRNHMISRFLNSLGALQGLQETTPRPRWSMTSQLTDLLNTEDSNQQLLAEGACILYIRFSRRHTCVNLGTCISKPPHDLKRRMIRPFSPAPFTRYTNTCTPTIHGAQIWYVTQP